VQVTKIYHQAGMPFLKIKNFKNYICEATFENIRTIHMLEDPHTVSFSFP
jgi:hypothetical protein